MPGQQEKDSSEERHCHGHHQIRPIWLPHWHCAQVLYINIIHTHLNNLDLPTHTFNIQRWHQADHQKRGVKCEDGPWSGQFDKFISIEFKSDVAQDKCLNFLKIRFHLQVSYYFQLAQQHQQQLQQNSGSPTQAQQVCFKVLLSWISWDVSFSFRTAPESAPAPAAGPGGAVWSIRFSNLLQTTWILKACLQ